MKKYKFKFVALMVAVVLMLPNFTGAGALVDSKKDDDILTIEDIKLKCSIQDAAIKEHSRIMKAWQDKEGNIIYPKAYGGCYVDNNGKLIIKILNNDNSLQKLIEQLGVDLSVVVFVPTDISFIELNNIASEYATRLSEQYRITSVNINQKTSCAEIYIDGSIAKTDSNYLDNEHISIIENASFKQHIACVPGSAFDMQKYNDQSATIYRASIGCQGRYRFNGLNLPSTCFLTAGHVVTGCQVQQANIYMNRNFSSPFVSYNNMLSFNGSYCYASYSNAYVNGNNYTMVGDYAFLRNMNITSSNEYDIGSDRLQINGWLDFGYTYPPQGTTVFKTYGVSGCKEAEISGPMAWGYGVDFSGNNYGGHDYISGLVQVSWNSNCSQFSQNGDSGCTVYTLRDGGATAVLCGIVTGGDGTCSYYTPMQVICARGFEPYPYTNGYHE